MSRLSRLKEFLSEWTRDLVLRLDRRIFEARIWGFLHRRASGLVHRAEWIFIALALTSGASFFLPRNLWTGVLNVVLAALVVVGLFFKQQHGAKLCEECVTEFVIDAPEHAAQHKRRFWMYHHSTGPLVALAVPSLLPIFLQAPWRGIVYMIPAVGQCLAALLVRFHSSYQPWCPYCQDRGRGGDEPEAAPDPSGGHGRPLPVM